MSDTASFIGDKSPTNCDAQLSESIFQTRPGKLIAERKKEGFPFDKFVSNIDDNQQYLLDAHDTLFPYSDR